MPPGTAEGPEGADPQRRPQPAAERAAHLHRELAARAERQSGLRAGRAERLARIRACAANLRDAAAGEAAADRRDAAPRGAEARAAPPAPGGDAESLERFLAALVGSLQPNPAPAAPAAVVPLARPVQRMAAAGDAAGLARLPGAGPGLVGALIRAGVPDLATLAGLERAALAARLGPLARLIDLDAWIAFARAETAG